MPKKPSGRRPSSRSRSGAGSNGGAAVVSDSIQPSAASYTPAAADVAAPRAVVSFLADWQEHRDADPTAGGRLVLAYDPVRLAPAANAKPAVVGYAHFLPGGQLRTVPLSEAAAQAASDENGGTHLAAGDVTVPEDAQVVELWFEASSASGPRWDSRFGQNYRFAVAPASARPLAPLADAPADAPAAPAQAPTTVALRPGARRAPAAVRVIADGAVKENAFHSRPGYPSTASNLQTRLRVTARVRDADEATTVYVDVHVLDDASRLAHAETFPLRFERGPDDVGPQFVLDAPLYQGTVASPGSVSPRPDAWAVEYRVYAEIDGRLRTDGLVHRCELKPDSGSAYEPTESA